MTTLLVTGSRSIKDKALVFKYLDTLDFVPSKVIHGGAPGVDTLAGEWAKSKDIPIQIVRPDFVTYPVAKYRWKAYTVRDYKMVDLTDKVIAIWDGKSSGTRLTFEYADHQNKLLMIHKVKIHSS